MIYEELSFVKLRYVNCIGEQVPSHSQAEEKVSAYIVCSVAVFAEGNVDVVRYIGVKTLDRKHGSGDIRRRLSR